MISSLWTNLQVVYVIYVYVFPVQNYPEVVILSVWTNLPIIYVICVYALLYDAAKATLRPETLRNCVRCNNRKRWCKTPVKKGAKRLR